MFDNVTQLSQLEPDQEGDFFALFCAKETMKTKDGKPYFRVTFRDAARETSFPIWNDSTWFQPCQDDWTPGEFFKLRAFYRETKYGSQLDIRNIRHTTEEDKADGFDPAMCMARSRFDPETMFDEMMSILEEYIQDEHVLNIVQGIYQDHKEELLTLPAAKKNHHAYLGGYLEHVLSVVRSCCYFADKYADMFPDMQPPLDKGLVIAGAALHDIGKLQELTQTPAGAEYSSSGSLIGHILQGRDILREAATDTEIHPEKLLRLEHIIVSHQRLPEWGSPKPPMTPEALIVHYADDIDAKLHMMVKVLSEDSKEGPMTSRQNILRQAIFRGEQEPDS